MISVCSAFGQIPGQYSISALNESVGVGSESLAGHPDTRSFAGSRGDNRSYRVSFKKIREHLPGFQCRWNVESGARQLRQVFEQIGMTEQIFTAPPFTRLQQLKHLLTTQQIDANLYWRSHDIS